jgi:hypothetical protein
MRCGRSREFVERQRWVEIENGSMLSVGRSYVVLILVARRRRPRTRQIVLVCGRGEPSESGTFHVDFVVFVVSAR